MRSILAASFILMVSGTAAWAADDAGKATYEKQCKSCHGADGAGNADKAKMLKLDAAKLNLLSAETAGMTRDDVKKVITDGKEKMPAYSKKLKPEEIDPVVDYTMGLKKAAKK